VARAESFDAILLDFNLPDIDGAQVGLVMRPVFKNIPLIALTAQDDRATRNKAKHFGFDAFVGKPWSMLELLATVQEHISRRTQKIH
jgi:DNA-binding response OmpR family regulator